MALDILPHTPASPVRLAPVEARDAPIFCFVLLTTACALASLALACVTPFAAFAVIAAAMLPLPSALVVMAAVWLVNQAIGFGLLGYPFDTNTLPWGFVIGAAALAATAASVATLRAMQRSGSLLALGCAFIAAYAAYELVLFAATAFLGGAADFSAAIVTHLGLLDLVWLIALVAVCELYRLLNPLGRRQTAS